MNITSFTALSGKIGSLPGMPLAASRLHAGTSIIAGQLPIYPALHFTQAMRTECSAFFMIMKYKTSTLCLPSTESYFSECTIHHDVRTIYIALGHSRYVSSNITLDTILI